MQNLSETPYLLVLVICFFSSCSAYTETEIEDFSIEGRNRTCTENLDDCIDNFQYEIENKLEVEFQNDLAENVLISRSSYPPINALKGVSVNYITIGIDPSEKIYTRFDIFVLAVKPDSLKRYTYKIIGTQISQKNNLAYSEYIDYSFINDIGSRIESAIEN